MSELKIVTGYLEACQAWQEVINAQSSPASKADAGNEAMRQLTDQTPFGTRNVIVGGDTALHIPDGTNTLEEQVWPFIQFGELKASGWLGRLYCVTLRQETFLTWPIYNPSILGPVSEEDALPGAESRTVESEIHRLPIYKELERVIHFPVGLINYAICSPNAPLN